MKKQKQRKGKLLLGVLVAVVALGVGYAAITNINLAINGTATATGSADDSDFKVRFVNSLDTENDSAAVAEAAANHATYVRSSESITAQTSVTGETTATFEVSDMQTGDYVIFTYYIANLSNDLKTKINVPTVTNDKSDYFSITVTPNSEVTLDEGEVQALTVRVDCINQAKLDTTGTFTVSFTAEAIE